MIKRQQRIARITSVLQDYLAARTASDLLTVQTNADPNYGRNHGWEPRAVVDFTDNLEATYIIRIYAEFESALRDYWLTYRRKTTRPPMYQLVKKSIPVQSFPQDVVDHADEVREYRNFLVHDVDDEPSEHVVIFNVREAKSRLCAYLSRLDPSWR